MSPKPGALVTGIGVVCAGARNVAELRCLLARPRRHFAPPTLFPCSGASTGLPVAEAAVTAAEPELPRTHQLAWLAAREAVGSGPAPDAIVLGTTTGGILRTEAALRAGSAAPADYRCHGLDTVALHLAQQLGVRGPVITLSTACSSAAVALAVAQALLRAGLVGSVLAGGADSLSRLTFHGFRSLQLLAPRGCAPLDLHRAGMTLGEGAGFLLLEAKPGPRPVLAVLAGTGLSCDAYHTTSPHPEGVGAAQAMACALEDAGLAAVAVDYLNLHGTGTPDNDAAEAKALRRVFGPALPALSSTKGLTGHALAAAGAIEAVIGVMAIRDGLLPANTGLATLDPTLGLSPLTTPTAAAPRVVLSNSFGFGGNNACIVLAHPSVRPCARAAASADARVGPPALPALRVGAVACFTAAGDLEGTWAALSRGDSATGLVPDLAFAQDITAPFARRLKRLPRLLLALAQAAYRASGSVAPPGLLAVGTAWASLADTYAFLRKLGASHDEFGSPIDFVGSVHNAPAGQIALLLGATGPNLTCSAGDRSFAQSLLCASLGLAAGSALVMAAEAHEPGLSPFLEPAAQGADLSEGGAAFYLLPDDQGPGPRLRWLGEGAASATALLDTLGLGALSERYDAVLLSLPAALSGGWSCAELLALPAPSVIPVRRYLGQHASVSATVAAVAARAVVEGCLPLAERALPLVRKRLLLLDAGPRASAVEVFA
jgi:3-oxoacyl-(acyl-carrier-protein) synthase